MKRIISTLLVCVLLIGCVFTLASCGTPAANPEDAKAALTEAGYAVTLTENTTKYAGLKYTLFAYKNDLLEKQYDFIEIYYFGDDASANTAWETLKTVFEEEAKKVDVEYAIEGSMVYMGTPDAISGAEK